VAERVTITIEPSDAHGGQLTVQDAMRQVLDFIEVVAAAASDDARPNLEWGLLSATTNSPFTAVAEAISVASDWGDVEEAARVAKLRAQSALKSAYETGDLPTWVNEEVRGHIRGLLERNMKGVAITSIRFDEESPPVVLNERRARAAIDKLDVATALQMESREDLSGDELGSVDAHVLDTTTYYNKPALRVRDRLSNAKIICVFSPELASKIGKKHSWYETWKGERVLITGRMSRNVDGVVTHIKAEEIRDIKPEDVTLSDIVDSGITGGKGVREYLEEDWD